MEYPLCRKNKDYFDYIQYNGRNLHQVKEICSCDEDVEILLGDGTSNPALVAQKKYYGKWGELIPGDYILRNIWCEVEIITENIFQEEYKIVKKFLP